MSFLITFNETLSTLPKNQMWLQTGEGAEIETWWRWDGLKWVKTLINQDDIEAAAKAHAEAEAAAAKQAAKEYAFGLLQSLANGEYSGTFIDGTSIISPTVVGLQGTFAELMAGNPFGARLELGESAGEPFLEAYDSENDLRVRLLQDSLEFSAGGITGGKLWAEYFGAGVEGEDRAGLLLSSTYSIKLQAFYYAWMETYGAAVQCAGEIVQAWADMGIYFYAPEIKVRDGVLRLRDPGTSTHNRQLDFTGGYGLFRDATGAGGNDTRLWLDTPDFGEVVIGPRSSSSYLGRLRIRAWDILLDGDPLLRPQLSGGKGFVGSSTYPFAQMHSLSFVQASSERIKTDIFDMDCKDAYNKVKDLKVRRYKYVGKRKREHLGLISEESPYEILSEDGEGVDLYAYISMLAAAVQEMQAKIEVLEKTISDLRG